MKKLLAIITSVALSLSLFVACGGGGASTGGTSKAESTATEGKVTLNFISTGASFWENLLNPILEDYEKETGVKINIEYYQHEQLFQTLEVKLGAGSTDYDIIGVDVPMVAGYVNRGYLASMDEYFTAEEKAGFIPSAVNAGSWQGEFYCPPMNSSSQLLWFNTALLEEAGIPIPTNTVENRITWEEVVALAKEAKAKLDPDGIRGISPIMFEQVGRIYQMLALPNSMGAPSIGEDGVTVEGIIDSPEWISALEFYKSLFDDGLSLRGVSADETGNNFLAGKTVFHIGGTWNQAKAEVSGFKEIGCIPCPTFEGYENKVATPTGSWHFGLSAFSKHPQEAADFIKYISLGEGNAKWLKANGDIPSTQAGIDMINNDANAPQYMKIAAYEAGNTAVARPVTPGYAEYETIVNAMLEDIRNGSEVQGSVNSATAQLKTALEKYK